MRVTRRVANKVDPIFAANYDYIVVGGGVAGALVASNLATEGNRTLVVERGPNVTVPWHKTVPLGPMIHRAQGRYIRKIDVEGCPVQAELPCVLGGAGIVLGARSYIRGHKNDWVDFPAKYDYDIESFYKRLENIEGTAHHRGNEGRLMLSKARQPMRLHKPILEGMQSFAMGLVPEFNIAWGFKNFGVGRAETLISFEGIAQNSVNAFVDPTIKMKRPLALACSATATGVQFSDTGASEGVWVKDAGASEAVLVNARRVVLAGGAIGTAQVLLGSTGLPEEAKQHVGKNLWGVPSETVQFRLSKEQPISAACFTDKVVQLLCAMDYRMHGHGWLATNYDDMVCYHATERELNAATAEGRPVYPDVRILVQPFMTDASGKLSADEGFQFVIQHIRPPTRGHVADDGTVHLPEAFGEEATAVIEDAKATLRKAATKLVPMYCAPDPEVGTYRTLLGPFGGTCALGTAVHESTMKLRGSHNTYVCDSSLVPRPLCADMVPLAMVLAERMSQRLSGKMPPLVA